MILGKEQTVCIRSVAIFFCKDKNSKRAPATFIQSRDQSCKEFCDSSRVELFECIDSSRVESFGPEVKSSRVESQCLVKSSRVESSI